MANSVAIADAFRFIKLPDDSIVAADEVGDTLTFQTSGLIITSDPSSDTISFTVPSSLGLGSVFLTSASDNTNYFLPFSSGQTGDQFLFTDSPLTFNPSTNLLSAPFFSGDGANLSNLTANNLLGTIPSVVLANSNVYIGTTAIALNRSSAAQTLNGVDISGNASTATNATSASTATTASNLSGGNNSTLLGSIPYQSNTDTTSLVSPNTTVTRKFLRMTGDGTNGAVPSWDTFVSSDIPTLNQNTTGTAAGITGTYLQNQVYATPDGLSGAGGFRSLVASDIPNLSSSKVGLGNVTNESKATMFSSPTFTGTATVANMVFNIGSTVNEFSSDSTLVDDSNSAVPTESAVKGYVDNKFSGAVQLTGSYSNPSWITGLSVSQGGTGSNNAAGALDNLLPSGEIAGYILKTSGPGTYFWAAETGASTIIGTQITTSRVTYTATSNQTLFTGVGTYTIGGNQLRVYINGVRQHPSSYTETSTTSFTLAAGVSAGTAVLAEVDGYTNYGVTANAVTSTAAGNISSTNVQAALEELDTEKAAKISPTFTTSIDGGATFSAFSSSTNLTIGPSIAGSTTISSGVISSGNRIVNIGIGGNTGSSTSIYIGSAQGSSTTYIQGAVNINYSSASSPTTINGHLTVEGVTSTGATGTGKFVFDNSPTFSGTGISGPATYSAFSSTTDLTLGSTSTSSSSTTNISTGALSGAYTKTINIGTNGTTGSTTTINIGSAIGTTVNFNGTITGSLLSSPTFSGTVTMQGATQLKEIRETIFTGGATSGTITPDAANGSIQTITLTGSITFNAFANPVTGQSLTLIVKQPAAGGPYTLTSTMAFASGSKTLSTAANATDMISVTYLGGTTYLAALSKGFG